MSRTKPPLSSHEVFKRMISLKTKPHCQNQNCDNFMEDNQSEMLKIGTVFDKTINKNVQQYRCKKCKKRVGKNLFARLMEFNTRSLPMLDKLYSLTGYLSDTEMCEQWNVPRTTLKTLFKEIHKREMESSEADFMFSQVSPPDSYEISIVRGKGLKDLTFAVVFIFKNGESFINQILVFKDLSKKWEWPLEHFLNMAPIFSDDPSLQADKRVKPCTQTPKIGIPLCEALELLKFDKMTRYSSLEHINYRMSLFKVLFNNLQKLYLEKDFRERWGQLK